MSIGNAHGCSTLPLRNGHDKPTMTRGEQAAIFGINRADNLLFWIRESSGNFVHPLKWFDKLRRYQGCG